MISVFNLLQINMSDHSVLVNMELPAGATVDSLELLGFTGLHAAGLQVELLSFTGSMTFDKQMQIEADKQRRFELSSFGTESGVRRQSAGLLLLTISA
jgi:hypothetical protein